MPDLRFIASDHPGGRILLRCGRVDVGAVFPPVGNPTTVRPWFWRVWITGNVWTSEGCAKSEQAAKNAAMAAFRDFLTAAGLTT